MAIEAERVPAVQDLDHFAQQLPPEHRAKLYRVAEDWLCIGVGRGILIGAMGKIPEPDDHKMYVEYFQKKAAENKVAK